MCTLNWRCKI